MRIIFIKGKVGSQIGASFDRAMKVLGKKWRITAACDETDYQFANEDSVFYYDQPLFDLKDLERFKDRPGILFVPYYVPSGRFYSPLTMLAPSEAHPVEVHYVHHEKPLPEINATPYANMLKFLKSVLEEEKGEEEEQVAKRYRVYAYVKMPKIDPHAGVSEKFKSIIHRVLVKDGLSTITHVGAAVDEAKKQGVEENLPEAIFHYPPHSILYYRTEVYETGKL